MSSQALLDRIEEVCPLPASVQRVIAKVDDPRASIGDVAAAVGLDAGLSAEVLRLANSPVYGRPRTVVTLTEAVSTLGLVELRNMATAMAMLAAFASEHERAPELSELAVVRGALAGALARRQQATPAIAYLAGLLADIGALALLAVDPEGYGEVLALCEGDPQRRSALETERYGTRSRDIGSELLRRNGVPDAVVGAVSGIDMETALNRVVAAACAWAPEVHRAADVADKVPTLMEIASRCGCELDETGVAELLVEAGQQARGMFKAAS